jgi:hypothetical protein
MDSQMSVSADSLRVVEQNLLQQAEVLAVGLAGLKVSDADRAEQLLVEITERLETIVGLGASASPSGPAGSRPRPVVVSTRPAPVTGGGGDEIEEFVLEILADSPRGLNVQEIVDFLKEADLNIRRQTLVVRLHRMERAGKLASLAHGHYALSEAERGRRRV